MGSVHGIAVSVPHGTGGGVTQEGWRSGCVGLPVPGMAMMVPHIAIEEALLNAAGLNGPVLAVTGVPDERKGEKLVVLYTPECGDPQTLWQALENSDLPNLWRPDRNAYYPVEAIPVLGSGKVDLVGMKKLAQGVSGSK